MDRTQLFGLILGLLIVASGLAVTGVALAETGDEEDELPSSEYINMTAGDLLLGFDATFEHSYEPDGETKLYIASRTDIAESFNLTGDQVWISNFEDMGQGVGISPDGDYIYIIAQGGDLVQLNRDTGEVQWSVDVDDGEIGEAVAVGSDGYVYAGTRGDYLHKFAPNGTEVWTANATGRAQAIGVSTDGTEVYFGGLNAYTRAVSAENGSELWTYNEHAESVQNIVADPVNDVVYAVDSDRDLHAINATDGTQIWVTANVGTGAIEDLDVTPDGQYLITGEQSRYVHQYDTSNGTEVNQINVGDIGDETRAVAVDEDGDYVYVGLRLDGDWSNGEIKRFDLGTQTVEVITGDLETPRGIISPTIYPVVTANWTLEHDETGELVASFAGDSFTHNWGTAGVHHVNLMVYEDGELAAEDSLDVNVLSGGGGIFSDTAAGIAVIVGVVLLTLMLVFRAQNNTSRRRRRY